MVPPPEVASLPANYAALTVFGLVAVGVNWPLFVLLSMMIGTCATLEIALILDQVLAVAFSIYFRVRYRNLPRWRDILESNETRK